MRSLFLPLLLLLAGCASVPPVQQPTARPALAGQSPFALSGRISIKYDGKRTSSGLYWTHTVTDDEIALSAPLGQTVARIKRDPQGVVLDTSDKHYEAENAEELTQQVLGWKLPLDGLRYWVFALPDPKDKASTEFDPNGQVSVMHQDGWEIRYMRYASSSPDSLPLRLILKRDELEIQLLIDTWDIPR